MAGFFAKSVAEGGQGRILRCTLRCTYAGARERALLFPTRMIWQLTMFSLVAAARGFGLTTTAARPTIRPTAVQGEKEEHRKKGRLLPYREIKQID